MELKARNVPCIGPKDCRIARRCKVFLGTEFGRGPMVQEDLFGWPPIERRGECAAANLQAESYLEREHNARWAVLGVAHATSDLLTECPGIGYYISVILRNEITVRPSAKTQCRRQPV